MYSAADFFGGYQTKAQCYRSVCTLFSERGGAIRPCGSAVLIAHNYALSASHCVMEWQPNLWLRSALSPYQIFPVTSLILEPDENILESQQQMGAFYQFGTQPAYQYPRVRERKYPEGLVLLKLGISVPEDWCAEFSSVDMNVDDIVKISAGDPLEFGAVRYARMRVSALHASKFDTVQSISADFPRASGGPAFLDYGSEVRVAGVQPSVRNSNKLTPNSVAEALLITESRRQWIRYWLDHEPSPVEVHQPHGPSPRRYIIVRRRDSMVLSGGDVLLEHSDADFYHGKVWNLLGSGTLGLLTSNGVAVTSRCNQASDEHRIELFTFQQRVRAEFSLIPGGQDVAPLWLHGWTCFDSRLVHVYLYRVENKERSTGCEVEGRIRIEAFELKGAYEDHAPDEHLVVFLRPTETIEAARKRAEEFFRNRAASQPIDGAREFLELPGPLGYVQDDVANGHEGHKPR
jgi:hypothetical protein